MGRSRKKLPFFERVKIEDVGAEGKAIARIDGIIVFCTYVVPGDVVDLQVVKKRKRYMEARVTAIHEYSAEREEAFCEHFGTCGGCKWQTLPYTKQLEYKQKQVLDALVRIGHFDAPVVAPITAAPQTRYYRNKLEYTFSNKKWLTQEQIQSGQSFEDMNALGFHIPGMFDKVLDINNCHLQAEPSNRIRLAIKAYATKHQLTFFDIRQQTGFLRNLIIRNTSTGELMVLLSFFYEDQTVREALLQYLQEEFPQITSLMYVINSKKNDTIGDLDIKLFHGRDHIFEEMEGLKFKIGPKSFYQTNSEQAYKLYALTREFIELQGHELVYDLYTGTGTIANFIARQVKQVVGIEYVPEAIADAKENSRNNNIDNTLFYAGDMKDVLTPEFIQEHGKPDAVIVDPPRAGLHPSVIEVLLETAAEKIVYVSCNPASQARDMELLKEKYQLVKVQAVDMFPHTHHIENIALLKLNK